MARWCAAFALLAATVQRQARPPVPTVLPALAVIAGPLPARYAVSVLPTRYRGGRANLATRAGSAMPLASKRLRVLVRATLRRATGVRHIRHRLRVCSANRACLGSVARALAAQSARRGTPRWGQLEQRLARCVRWDSTPTERAPRRVSTVQLGPQATVQQQHGAHPVPLVSEREIQSRTFKFNLKCVQWLSVLNRALAGTYSSQPVASTSCSSCPAGQYSESGRGPGGCSPCAVGYFGTSSGATAHTCSGTFHCTQRPTLTLSVHPHTVNTAVP